MFLFQNHSGSIVNQASRVTALCSSIEMLIGHVIATFAPAATLCALKFIIQRAKETSRKRVAAGTQKRKTGAALLESPSAKRKKTAVNAVGFESPRNKLLQKLAQNLASPAYVVYFPALLKCKAEAVTSAEAMEHCLDGTLQQLLARDKTLPV